jgi:hypothetical protein
MLHFVLEEREHHIGMRHDGTTLTQYRASANKIREMIPDMPAKDFSTRVADDNFINDLIASGLANTTVNKHRRHLRVFMSNAEERECFFW